MRHTEHNHDTHIHHGRHGVHFCDDNSLWPRWYSTLGYWPRQKREPGIPLVILLIPHQELKEKIDKRTTWINNCLIERDRLIEQFEAMGGNVGMIAEVE
jgi:hypothetical protein